METLAEEVFNVSQHEREEIFVFVDAVNFKNKVEVPPHRNNQHLKGHDYACNHRRISIDNEMTTPKSFHDVTTATKNSA